MAQKTEKRLSCATSGKTLTVAPVKAEILGPPKQVTAKINAVDPTQLDIEKLAGKSGSVRVKLTYPGGVSKTVTVRVKQK